MLKLIQQHKRCIADFCLFFLVGFLVTLSFLWATGARAWDHTVIMFPPAGATFTVPLVENARNCVYVTDCTENITTTPTTPTEPPPTEPDPPEPVISDLPVPRGAYGWTFGVPIDKTGWTVEVDNEEQSDANKTEMYQKAHAIDGDPNTIWHTKWTDPPVPMPHWIIIDMNAQHWVDSMTLWPRPYDPAKAYSTNSNVKDYEVWVGNDGNAWGRVANGAVKFITGQPVTIDFLIPNKARYVKLVVTSATNNTPAVAVGEIDIMESLRDITINAGGIN